MHARHIPDINTRYWFAITLASVFGTNMGDLYAHESGLGLLGGLPVLAALFLAVFAVERVERYSHDAYYWLCIVILRTGATNVADYMAGRQGMHIDRVVLSAGFAVLLALFAWWLGRRNLKTTLNTLKAVPNTDSGYWVTMLVAGIFGTVFGDYLQHALGDDQATFGLAVVLGLVLLAYRKVQLGALAVYWIVIAVARTAGTAIGDWLAESPHLGLGLPASTIMTGALLAAVLILGRSGGPKSLA